ncbi:MAG: NYN domain-containing protein [Ardenticatenaceae bacterium]|nr:NYN domain-containing protein [Ardenticatenaceae bacterium]MCB9443736.1 NYN domain-containing protein [Ardenticatenaceae bacterium]
MSNDIAIFLDLDNLVIGAKQINLDFDINLILNKIKELTNGRIVLRRSYGDWRQSTKIMQDLAAAGFNTQSSVRLNSFSKNVADMQIVVDAMETLVENRQYSTYVLMTGDRDFTPLVQTLRKRGKRVIGVGVQSATSASFAELCDEYLYYENLIPSQELTEPQIEDLLVRTLDALLKEEQRVRASVLSQRMQENSRGTFDKSSYPEKNFRQFLARFPHIVRLEQEDSTTYVTAPIKEPEVRPLHLRYRSVLKKQRMRVVPATIRFLILKDIVTSLDQEQPQTIRWRNLIDNLAEKYQTTNPDISKNSINAIMLAARQAQVIRTLKAKTLAMAPVLLAIKDEKPFQEAVKRCDAAYLQGILNSEEPFDLEEAALALYDTPGYTRYLQVIMKKWVEKD